jgi:hypothetical protein
LRLERSWLRQVSCVTKFLADLFYKGKAALNCVFNAEPQIDVSYVQQP